VPCIALRADTLFADEGDDLHTAAIRLDFDYGGRRIRSSDRRFAGRDRAAENAACRVLEGFGAVELASLTDRAATPGSQIDYVIAVDGDVHALCAFSAYVIPQLRALGWCVDIDPAYPWQVVGADVPLYASAERAGGDWFALELGVELDGHRIDLLQTLLDMLDGVGELAALGRPRRCIAVKIDDRHWLPLPPDRLRLVAKVLLELYGERRVPAPRAPLIAQLVAAIHDGARPLRWIGDAKIRDHAFALAMPPRADVALPLSGLRAELRPYQRDGIAWLQHLRANAVGGVLADDMGLGKTLQTIAHILIEKTQGRLDRPALIVAPTSVLGNWKRECAKFAPELRVLAYHGAARHDEDLTAYDIVVTSYSVLVRDRDELEDLPFHLVVLDEAHAIKSHDTQVAEAARALQSRHRLCLSGTPIENHLGELWSLFDFVLPGLLGSKQEFATTFRQPIEERGDAFRLEALRDRVRPYVLRRTKSLVAPELPAKTQLVRAVDLGGAQRELYESIRVAAHADVRRCIAANGLARSTIAILDALLKLRQVCCDPRLVNVDAAKGITSSAKLELLLEMIPQQLADGRRILVFSQFARMLGLISEALLARGIRHVALTGATVDRQRPIDAFQQGRADVFLISLKAGGTGLNLTGADTVIHYDPWWNPAAQAQASDRAHRIGQTRAVFVHDLVVAGSVEERMLSLQRFKRKLADAILEPGKHGLTELDVDDLLAPLE